jgi:hypothetical protein
MTEEAVVHDQVDYPDKAVVDDQVDYPDEAIVDDQGNYPDEVRAIVDDTNDTPQEAQNEGGDEDLDITPTNEEVTWQSDSESDRFFATASESDDSPDAVSTRNPRRLNVTPTNQGPSRPLSSPSDITPKNLPSRLRPGQKWTDRPPTLTRDSPGETTTPQRKILEPTTRTIRELRRLASYNNPGLSEGKTGGRLDPNQN